MQSAMCKVQSEAQTPRPQAFFNLHFALCILHCLLFFPASQAYSAARDPKVQKAVTRGLEWVANSQSKRGHWTANDSRYPTAMTALAGMALLAEGSTTTQG
jgi:hypothetical protein